ncbi:MAG: hypothetical protein IT334_08955, partial [Thermomicrobiales bacterium]|nr:hypothetical protein [Thermomicrobiales bacterium]
MSRFHPSRRPGIRRALTSVALLFTLVAGVAIGANGPFAEADTNLDSTEAFET